MITAAEPFAGCGGLAIGLGLAGFKCVYATDKDREAVGTLAQSVEAADCIMHSLETVAPFARAVRTRTSTLDLLAAGVPCQPFSQPGLNLGNLDPRDCFPHFTAMAHLIEPRAIMIENVASLTNAKHGPYLEAVLARLRQEYTIDYRVLCSADYGVPQARQRLIVVGFRDPEAAKRFAWPETTHGEEELGAAKGATGSYWEEHGLSRPVGEGIKTSAFNSAFQRNQGRPGFGKAGGTKGFGLTFVTNADRPCPTIAVRRPFAAAFLGDPKVVVAATPGELKPGNGLARWRTVRDVFSLDELVAMRGQWMPPAQLARLQGFPESLRFVGKTADVIRQIGNAVPPRLAEVVGREIAKALDG